MSKTILFNSINLDCDKKIRDSWFCALGLRRLSDLICLEHGMSVIKPFQGGRSKPKFEKTYRQEVREEIDKILEQKPQTFQQFLRMLMEDEYEIKKGKYIALKAKERKNFIRLKSLGAGYSEEELREVIEGTAEHKKSEPKYVKRDFDMLIDIQEKLRQGKGAGYVRWGQRFNNKAIMKTLLYLDEKGIRGYDDLAKRAEAASGRFSELSDTIKSAEKRMAEISTLRTHIINYSKTRDVYVAYCKAGYSKKFFETHREEITLHKAAKEAFKQLGGPIPKVKARMQEAVVIRVSEISRRKWKQKCHFVRGGLSMLYEEPRETELAFKIADRIISIQECDGGYDYSIMNEHYREIDGGVYDDPAVDINFVLFSIVEELKENPDTNGAKGNITKESKLIPLDYDEVAEMADIANMAGPAVYSSRVVMEFKAKTEECFQPIDGLGATEIEELVEEYVTSKLSENDFDASVRGVVISGSRCRGLEGKASDLDVVVELSGDESEDDLFNLLHEDNFKIGGVPVDINPITKYKSGTLEEYLPGVEKYLEEKYQKASVRKKLKEKKSEIRENDEKADKDNKKKSENVR